MPSTLLCSKLPQANRNHNSPFLSFSYHTKIFVFPEFFPLASLPNPHIYGCNLKTQNNNQIMKFYSGKETLKIHNRDVEFNKDQLKYHRIVSKPLSYSALLNRQDAIKQRKEREKLRVLYDMHERDPETTRKW